MRVLLTGNCQVDGLHVFLSRALPNYQFRRLPHLATFYQEFSEEKIAEDHAWADLVFFHHKHDHPQDYPTKQPKIPLSVWFQSSPFLIQLPDSYWIDYIQQGGTVDQAIHYDFDYQKRWEQCWLRMVEKEENEKVPKDIQIRYVMEVGTEIQLQITCNHPTSYVFWCWSNRILEFLGEKGRGYSKEECLANPNIAGLPCEESATSGAREALGLKWGGRPEDDESGRQVARERFARLKG